MKKKKFKSRIPANKFIVAGDRKPDRLFTAIYRTRIKGIGKPSRPTRLKAYGVLGTTLLASSAAAASAVSAVQDTGLPAIGLIATISAVVGGIVAFTLINEIPDNDE